MSEQGWRQFLAADGLADWVVLHCGATAVFRAGSLCEAASLADAVSQVPGFDGTGAMLTLTDMSLTVRLTRGVYRLEEGHVGLARAVSAVAKSKGAVAMRAAVQEVQLAIAAQPEVVDIEFWRAVLGYEPQDHDAGVDPLGLSSTVWLQELSSDKPLRHAMHIDVSLAREEAESRVAAALHAGGVVVEEKDAPMAWILADRAGNKVCVTAWPDGATR